MKVQRPNESRANDTERDYVSRFTHRPSSVAALRRVDASPVLHSSTAENGRITEHGTRDTEQTFPSPLAPRPSSNAFTLVEILIAIGILGMVLAAIFSSWTAILRASKVGLDAAAAVQRSRIVMRTIEDSLLCAQSYALSQKYYGFEAKNGSDGYLSFVAKLPESFPRSRKFGDLRVRRVTFSVESGPESSHQLVLRQSPLLMELDNDENEHPLVLARYVSDFSIEFWNNRTGEWDDEWKQTNQMPKLVKFSLRLADNAYAARPAQQELVRIVQLPAMTVPPDLQLGRGGPLRPAPQRPGVNPNTGLPNQPFPQQPGQPPVNVNPIIPIRPQ